MNDRRLMEEWERVTFQWMEDHREDVQTCIRLITMVRNGNLPDHHAKWVLPESWKSLVDGLPRDGDQLLGRPIIWADVTQSEK